jgi:hypothetical protein
MWWPTHDSDMLAAGNLFSLGIDVQTKTLVPLSETQCKSVMHHLWFSRHDPGLVCLLVTLPTLPTLAHFQVFVLECDQASPENFDLRLVFNQVSLPSVQVFAMKTLCIIILVSWFRIVSEQNSSLFRCDVFYFFG